MIKVQFFIASRQINNSLCHYPLNLFCQTSPIVDMMWQPKCFHYQLILWLHSL